MEEHDLPELPPATGTMQMGKPRLKVAPRAPAPLRPANIRNRLTLWRALNMRQRGRTLIQIAARLKLRSALDAQKVIERALDITTREPAESVRAMELFRLDYLTRKLGPMVAKGQLSAIDRTIKVMELRGRLLGLFINQNDPPDDKLLLAQMLNISVDQLPDPRHVALGTTRRVSIRTNVQMDVTDTPPPLGPLIEVEAHPHGTEAEPDGSAE